MRPPLVECGGRGIPRLMLMEKGVAPEADRWGQRITTYCIKKNESGRYSTIYRILSQSITAISNAIRMITTHSRKFECWIRTSSDNIE
jgi:ribosomal protein S6